MKNPWLKDSRVLVFGVREIEGHECEFAGWKLCGPCRAWRVWMCSGEGASEIQARKVMKMRKYARSLPEPALMGQAPLCLFWKSAPFFQTWTQTQTHVYFTSDLDSHEPSSESIWLLLTANRKKKRSEAVRWRQKLKKKRGEWKECLDAGTSDSERRRGLTGSMPESPSWAESRLRLLARTQLIRIASLRLSLWCVYASMRRQCCMHAHTYFTICRKHKNWAF